MLRPTFLALILCFASCAGFAADLLFLELGTNQTSIPIGHYEFCKVYPAECQIESNGADMPLTPEVWDELLAVNLEYNTRILPMEDIDNHGVGELWSYVEQYGDCEDYVLAKRRELLKRGWPTSALIMAVVLMPTGEGHAVLIARTTEGDYVLDNRFAEVYLWSKTRYDFIKGQSPFHTGKWVLFLGKNEFKERTKKQK